MKKVFGQTVRDLKRGVNKKVLKVPGVEQKVLDATSNEPWGPHGSLLADIAEATRNYHECQMIMGVLWKRISDTGKNWRHVYKALTVLEYLVAHGSERVIDEIREHAYQISTLSDFQYIDSSGRDQGNNVRKKSQGLVILVNDKDRIQEVRQKADANREKFRGTSAGARRPSPYSGAGGYDDPYEGRYGSRDDDRNAYGRERDGNRDDDRYGRYGDSYSRDGDRYGRVSEERYNYRDDDDSSRGRNADDYDYGSGSRSSDRERPDDDGQSSSRGNAIRADDSQDERGHEQKISEQNLAPPSYEEAVGESRSPVYQERDGETPTAAPARTLSPAGSHQATTPVGTAASPENQEDGGFDEFDPRNSFTASAAAPASSNAAPATPTASAAPAASTNVEMDLLGSLSDAFDSNELAIMPATSEVDTMSNSGQAPTFSSSQAPTFSSSQAPNSMNQPFGDPFGDGPFKAISTDSATAQQPSPASTVPFQPSTDPNADFGFGDSLSGITYSTPNVSDVQLPQFQSSLPNAQFQPPTESHFQPAAHFQPSSTDPQFQTHSTNMQFSPEELSNANEETDILADILPPSRPPPVAASQSMPNMYASFQAHGSTPSVAPNMVSQNPHGPDAQPSSGGFYNAPAVSYMPQAPPTQPNAGNFLQHGSSAPTAQQFTHQTIPGPVAQQNNDGMGNLFSQAGSNTVTGSQPAITSAGPLAIVPQQSREKFEPKSTVWADTLSRGLVNLNISGSKINPLSDIGIDFDAINRKDKRMERQPAAPVTSTTVMGRAMGSGSGLGRAGVCAMRAPQNPMIGPGMGGGPGAGMGMGGGPRPGMGMGGVPGPGMGMGGVPGPGMGMGGVPGPGMGMGGGPRMGMGGYGGMNQPMGMGMNMGMSQAAPMQQPQTGTGMPNGYYPMMGSGGYPQHQQPYGGGYR